MSGLEEIIFENRNKDYGCYELRKKYSKYLLWGFLLSIGLIFLTSATLFVIINSDIFFQPKMPKTIRIESLQLVDMLDLRLPDPPSASANQPVPDLSKPDIVDTLLQEKKNEPENTNPPQANRDSLTDHKGEGNSDNKGISNGDSLIYVRVDEMPEFVGGREAMARFLRNNLSASVKKTKVKTRVVVQFTISRSGELRDISIISGVDPVIDKEIVRVLSIMPRWNPGKQGGHPIDVRFRLPISI
jgi:periplasmic protein TonB